MLWTVILILVILWALGLLGSIGPIVHLLLIVALCIVLFQLLMGRRKD